MLGNSIFTGYEAFTDENDNFVSTLRKNYAMTIFVVNIIITVFLFGVIVYNIYLWVTERNRKKAEVKAQEKKTRNIVNKELKEREGQMQLRARKEAAEKVTSGK